MKELTLLINAKTPESIKLLKSIASNVCEQLEAFERSAVEDIEISQSRNNQITWIKVEKPGAKPTER